MKGRTIGFPTANIRISSDIFSGIYAGVVDIEGKNYKSAIYVGHKRPRVLEAHIIGFNGDLYGRDIAVTVGEKVREDYLGDDHEALVQMIREDVEKIKNI